MDLAPQALPVVDDLFARLGVSAVSHACVATSALVGLLAAEERQAVEQAAEPRRNEFAGGRACAHASLAALGVGQMPIVAARDRSPVWPVGTVGSISHCEGFCVASVTSQIGVSIGLDAEFVGAVTSEVAEVAMSVEERRWIAAYEDPSVMATAVFAAKEALYKAQHPVTASWLDFVDVAVDRTDAGTLRLELVTDVAELRNLTWPLTAAWAMLEPSPGRQLVVAAVVVRPA